MMRGRLLVIASLGAAVTAPLTHSGAVLSLSETGEWEAAPGEWRNASLLDVEPNSPVNPNCDSCTGASDGTPTPPNCCDPKPPSELNPKRCSVTIPKTWHLANRVEVGVWNAWVTKTCQVEDGKKGITEVYKKGTESLHSTCDPCRTSGMVEKGGDAQKWLYCENADNRKDYLTCFPATAPTFRLKCNPIAANDAFGGWELQGEKPNWNIPECNPAAKEWEVAFHDEGGQQSYNGTHTWPPDEEMACSESGSKDLTGTDACHDDYCVYEGGEVTYGTDAEPRWPFNNFESCAKEIEEKGLETACSTANNHGRTFRKGCRKSCGLCKSNIKQSAAPQEDPRARDDITIFKTCNKIARNAGVAACSGGKVGLGCTDAAGNNLGIMTNMAGTQDSCDSFNSKSDSNAMGQCIRHYHYNETIDEGYICYKKLETDPETGESKFICTQGPEYRCKWGDWASAQVLKHDAQGGWEVSSESGEVANDDGTTTTSDSSAGDSSAGTGTADDGTVDGGSAAGSSGGSLVQHRAVKSKSRADHLREAAARALRAVEAAPAELEAAAEAAVHAVAVSAAGLLAEATTTAAPDGPHVPYFKTRELARAAKRSVLEKEQRAKSLLEANSRAGARAHWRADTYFDCDLGGNKDTNGTDFCHDDFCVYEGGTKSTARKPYDDFVSCEFEAAQGACTKHGLSHFMDEGCRKTCGHCKATQHVPAAGIGYDIEDG